MTISKEGLFLIRRSYTFFKIICFVQWLMKKRSPLLFCLSITPPKKKESLLILHLLQYFLILTIVGRPLQKRKFRKGCLLHCQNEWQDGNPLTSCLSIKGNLQDLPQWSLRFTSFEALRKHYCQSRNALRHS